MLMMRKGEKAMETKKMLNQLNSLREHCKDFLDKDENNSVWAQDVKCLDLAIKVIEKQMPKKPAVEDEMGYFICPTCDIVVGYTNDREEHNYCFNCGQKIDWE